MMRCHLNRAVKEHARVHVIKNTSSFLYMSKGMAAVLIRDSQACCRTSQRW